MRHSRVREGSDYKILRDSSFKELIGHVYRLADKQIMG